METRDLIIETAFIAFIEHGYNRLSLNQIIKTTGLTKGAFYHYFSSKDELIQEVMNTYLFSHIGKTMDSVNLDNQTFKDRMDIIYNNIMNTDIELSSNPNKRIGRNEFMKLFWESMDMNDAMKSQSLLYHQNVIQVIKHALDVGVENKEIRADMNTEDVAKMILATVRGTILTTHLLPKAVSEETMKSNMKLLLELISL